MGRLPVHSDRRSGPRHSDEVIAALAAEQHGVVARRQLLRAGVSVGEIESRVRRHRLQRLHAGVYAFGHATLRIEGRWLAAVLACGESAVLSHRDAAHLWELRRDNRARIDVTAPRGRGPRPGIDVHRTRRLHPPETTTRRAIPVTSVARTLLDLAEVLSPRQLERVVDEADVLRLLDMREIDATMQRNRGRHGLGPLPAALDTHRGDQAPTLTRSELEERFLVLIRAAGLPEAEVNVQVTGFTVDFLWRRERVVAETDGRAFHTTRSAIDRDRRRDARLAAAGYQVLRFGWHDVTADATAVVATLAAVLAQRSLGSRAA